MTRRERQSEFAAMVPWLIIEAHNLGFEVTGGDWFRDPRSPYGSKKSAHHDKLAIDLNLFKNGKYLRATKHHRELGEWWESKGGIWGGRFKRTAGRKGRDGNHYEWPR